MKMFGVDFRSRFFRSVEGSKSGDNGNSVAVPSVTFDSMFSGAGGIGVSNQMAMRFTAVYAAIRLRAESVASLPKLIVEHTDNGRVEAKGHACYKLLKYAPNGYMNIFSFWEYINACLDGWGNSYVVILRLNSGVPGELIPIHPSLVTVTISNRKKWFRVVGSKGLDGVYSDDDMLHFFSLSEDGIKGINPIVYNSAAIKSGMSATAFGNEFFEKGGNIKGVYASDKFIGAKDYENMMMHLSKYKNHESPILEGGLKYQAIGIAPEAAQMLQTRTFALQDIARIFNVPPHLLADLSRSTFSNIEHQDIQFVKYSIRPSLKRFECELDRKLLFDDEMGRIETKFNIEGMLRGDIKTRAAYYHAGVQDGWLSRNEVRKMENRNGIDGLDEMLYPANLNIVGKEVLKEEKGVKKTGKE